MAVYNNNHIYLRNPWVVGWWSAAFPGFGHLNLGFYLKGVMLIIWEIVINNGAGMHSIIMIISIGRVR